MRFYFFMLLQYVLIKEKAIRNRKKVRNYINKEIIKANTLM